MQSEKLCPFCGEIGPHETIVNCQKVTYVPSGDPAMFGQIVDGAAVITIHEDVSIDDLAKLLGEFMDKIAQFPQVRDNPMAILGAIQKGMSG